MSRHWGSPPEWELVVGWDPPRAEIKGEDTLTGPSCPPAHTELHMEAQAFLGAAVSSLLFSFLVNAG